MNNDKIMKEQIKTQIERYTFRIDRLKEQTHSDINMFEINVNEVEIKMLKEFITVLRDILNSN